MKPIRIVILAAIISMVCSCNFITLPPPPQPDSALIVKNTVSTYTPERPPEVQVWMIADTLHTGMVFEYEWLVESGWIVPQGFKKSKYVTFSWGDRQAYLNHRWLTASEIFKAIFLPSPAVMECIPINWGVAEVSPNQHIWMKSIPREQGPYVAAFLNHSVNIDENGKPIILGPSSWGGGVLLESPQTYYFPRICNVWTGQALQSCGADITPILAIHRDTTAWEAKRNGFVEVWDGSGNKYVEQKN